jgi:hypothetical protein
MKPEQSSLFGYRTSVSLRVNGQPSRGWIAWLLLLGAVLTASGIVLEAERKDRTTARSTVPNPADFGKLVGDHNARLSAALAVKHPTQETLGSYLIASLLDQDVQYESVLIDGSPEPVAFAADLERYLVQMPLVASSYSSSTQPCGEAGSELRAPLADRLVADDDPAFGEEILNVTKAEMEPKVQPHSVSDDFGREAVAPIRRTLSGPDDGHQRGLIADTRST